MDISSLFSINKEPKIELGETGLHVNPVDAVLPIGNRTGSKASHAPPPVISLQTGDHPLQLVIRAVIEKLNELFHTSIHTAHSPEVSELELTPEVSAHHIASFAVTLFMLYKNQHAAIEQDDLLQQFTDTLYQGLEQGFEEARQVLSNLGVLSEATERNVNICFALTQKYLIELRSTDFMPK